MKTKTKKSLLTVEETETIYELVSEFFGSIKADSVYFEVTHPSY